MDVYHIHDLPIEVVGDVFSYLDVFDKLNVALVCKRWLEAVNCFRLMQDIKITVKYNSGSDMPDPLTRHFSSFAFVGFNLDLEHLEFFKHYGGNIRKLIFDSCSVSKKFRKSFYRQNLCVNLNILEFRNICLDIFPYLPKLNLLRFYNVIEMYHDITTIPWRNIAPHLKEVDFGAHELHSDNKDWSIYRDILINFGTITASLPDEFPYAKENFREFNDVRLKTFYAREFSSLQQKLITRHDSITDLSLASGVILNGDILQICKMLPLLEKLQLHDFGAGEINSCLINIFRMEKLKTLAFVNAKINKEFMIAALRAPRLPNLRELVLSNVLCEVGDELFKGVLLRNLSSLCLSGCDFITNATMHYIFKNLIYLRDLNLFCCYELTDEFSLCNKVDHSMSNIKGLRGLFIIACPGITATGLLNAIEFLELRYLTIDSNYYSKININNVKVRNPSIKKVQFGPMNFDSDEDVMFDT